ncbi:MAG: superinfection immunity protein [Bacteroidetes bacterium]|nr:superinfection immunity protein [Bacteroidota bacterium]
MPSIRESFRISNIALGGKKMDNGELVTNDGKTVTIDEWLSSIGMSQYIETFKSNGVEISHFQSLSDQDLQSMEITVLGHRKTILASIENFHESLQESAGSEKLNILEERSNLLIKRYFKVVAVLTILGTIIATITDGDPLFVFLACLFGGIGFFIYSIPGLIAFRKGHQYKWAILLANWFLGITGIVWLILLGFSLGLFGPGAAVALSYFADRK